MSMFLTFRAPGSESAASIGEWLEARKVLEVSIAGLAAEKRNIDDMHTLEAILDKMAQTAQHEAGLVEAADAEFHMAIAKCTHNEALIAMASSVMVQLEAAASDSKRPVWFAADSLARQMWREHRDIYQAIREHNAYLAQEKMKQHLFHVERVMLRFTR